MSAPERLPGIGPVPNLWRPQHAEQSEHPTWRCRACGTWATGAACLPPYVCGECDAPRDVSPPLPASPPR